MARLVIALVIVAVAALAVLGLGAVVGRVAQEGARDARFGGESMQKLSFFVLMALILYVSVWGGA